MIQHYLSALRPKPPSRAVTRILLVILFIPVLCIFCAAEEQGTATFSEDVEVRLELGRHERFLATRKSSPGGLSPFSTDGCSGGLSVGWEYLAEKIAPFQAVHGSAPPWLHCCVSHDHIYHSGGPTGADSMESFLARRAADRVLQECVLETGQRRRAQLSGEYHLSEEEVAQLYRIIAGLMYRAVRLGGVPCSGLPWRWGYGWPQCE